MNVLLLYDHLYNNEAGDAGAQAIGEGLKANKAVTMLNLGRNRIGAAGAQALGAALTTNTALAHLSLDSNEISVAGASAIGEALKVNTALTHCNLASMNDASWSAIIADSLSSNLWMIQLDFRSRSGRCAAITERNRALKQARKSQLASLLHASQEPSALLFEGWEVYRLVSRSIERGLFSLDYDVHK